MSKFKGTVRVIYLDNNATTQPDQVMLEKSFQIAQEFYANPSSPHPPADKAKEVLATARQQVANALGCKPNEVCFTSGGTEANGIALKTVSELGEIVIASDIEHASVYNCAVEKIPVSQEGHIDLNRLEENLARLQKHKYLAHKSVAIMAVNNETGIITDPTEEVPGICERYGVDLHVDAVQAFGKPMFDCKVDRLKCKTLSLSAHKVHGLKGAGALYVREGCKVYPAWCGGTHEFGVRPGTENQLGIFSLGYMAEKILTLEYQQSLQKVKDRRDRLEFLLADISEPNGSIKHRLDHVSSLYFPDMPDADLFIDELGARGVCASGKSACASGMSAPSRVLQAMYGESSDRPSKSVRFSLSIHTSDLEIEEAAGIIREVADSISL